MPFLIMGGSWAEHFDLITGPLQHITEHIRVIMSGSIDDLEAAAPTQR